MFSGEELGALVSNLDLHRVNFLKHIKSVENCGKPFVDGEDVEEEEELLTPRSKN